MNVDPDTISSAMFWVGALFVFTPIVCAGIVLSVWWHKRKKAQTTST
jgi:hypothetical protein